jgi:hypothetical protein
MKKLILLTIIIVAWSFTLIAGKPTTPLIPTSLNQHQINLSTGSTLQFLTDDAMVDSDFGNMFYTFITKNNTITIAMASESNILVDNALVLKFLTPTSGTFTRTIYASGTKSGSTRVSGTFTML